MLFHSLQVFWGKEGKSLYFKDPDGHKFEFHTKTHEDKIVFYKENRKHLKFYI